MLTLLPVLALALQPAADLTVTTFNIRYGTAADGENRWELRRSLFFEVLRAQQADVMGLQEALRFQLDEIAGELPEYGELGVGRDDGDTLGEYAAILYRADRLEVLEHDTFWLSPTPDVVASTGWGNRITRICTWARFRHRATGRTFHVFNVHFDHESQPSRERAADLVSRRILTRAHADPVILLGDFNAGETNPARTRLLAAVPLRDAFRVAHPEAREVGTFNGFEGTTTGEMIDAVLVSGGWDVLDARIDRTARDGRYPSDHFPVTVRFRLSPWQVVEPTQVVLLPVAPVTPAAAVRAGPTIDARATLLPHGFVPPATLGHHAASGRAAAFAAGPALSTRYAFLRHLCRSPFASACGTDAIIGQASRNGIPRELRPRRPVLVRCRR